jgi:hypothetical protein
MLHHLRFGRGIAAAACVAAGALFVPAAAQAKTETVTSGGVTATFTYHKASFGYKGLTLAISRGGKVRYTGAVNVTAGPAGCGPLCWPGNVSGGKSVHVLDLNHNGAKEVVLDLFSGGAHCCFYEQVYYANGSTYKHATRFFGDPGTAIADLRHNGRLEFDSNNPYFSSLYTSFAASGFPIQILTFRQGKFHDVTRNYPTLIAQNAADLLKGFKKHYDDGEGLIAAWTADEYMLGRKPQALAYLNAQAKAGHLNALDSSLKGQAFVLQLQKDLKKLGY